MFSAKKTLISLLCAVLVLSTGYNMFVPIQIVSPIMFTINENESLRSLSERLEKMGVVRSSTFLRAYLSFSKKDRKVQLGEYEFSGSVSLFSLAREITDEGPRSPLLSVTIPEGLTSYEIFQLFSKVLPSLNASTFNEIIKEKSLEGKLFPSTYHLLPSYKEATVIDLMNSVYKKRAPPFLSGATLPEPLKSEGDVLTLASILEGEANSETDMKIVSGILLNRMRIGMPLQVDVASSTYKIKGLPALPINNPGLTSIGAAINPVSTDYLYYITGKDGRMYYAKTFSEHKRNIQKYLK